MAPNFSEVHSICMPNALAELTSSPSYKIQPLDAQAEIRILGERVALLDAQRGFKEAYGVCTSSQTVLYALDEMKFFAGIDDPVYRSKLQEAADLLGSVEAYRESTLASVSADELTAAQTYFANVGKRHKELLKRQQR